MEPAASATPAPGHEIDLHQRPTASAVTPTVVRAGSLPGVKKLGHSALRAA